MEKKDVMERLVALLHEKFGTDPKTVTLQTRQDELGIDSILLVDLMLDIEDRMDFSFQSMTLPQNPSIDDICELVLQNRTP